MTVETCAESTPCDVFAFTAFGEMTTSSADGCGYRSAESANTEGGWRSELMPTNHVSFPYPLDGAKVLKLQASKCKEEVRVDRRMADSGINTYCIID